MSSRLIPSIEWLVCRIFPTVLLAVSLERALKPNRKRRAGGDLTNPSRVATPNRFSWATSRYFMFSTSLKF